MAALQQTSTGGGSPNRSALGDRLLSLLSFPSRMRPPFAMPTSSHTSLVAIVGLRVGACSQTGSSAYPGANQPRVVPDGQSLTVVNVDSVTDALPWATEYCAK